MNELKGPAYNQIIDYIKNKRQIEFHTVNNEVLNAKIIWHDKDVLNLMLDNGREVTLCKSAIVYYTPV